MWLRFATKVGWLGKTSQTYSPIGFHMVQNCDESHGRKHQKKRWKSTSRPKSSIFVGWHTFPLQEIYPTSEFLAVFGTTKRTSCTPRKMNISPKKKGTIPKGDESSSNFHQNLFSGAMLVFQGATFLNLNGLFMALEAIFNFLPPRNASKNASHQWTKAWILVGSFNPFDK